MKKVGKKERNENVRREERNKGRKKEMDKGGILYMKESRKGEDGECEEEGRR